MISFNQRHTSSKLLNLLQNINTEPFLSASLSSSPKKLLNPRRFPPSNSSVNIKYNQNPNGESNMFDPRRNRIHSKPKPNDSSHSFLSTKKALQKLSLSFYGLDTIKKTKQIILDDCQIYPPQTEINSIMQMISQEKKKYKNRGLTSHKNTALKIDTLFLDQKVDQFQFVTTNASQLQHRQRVDTKKKVSRSNSVKVKDKDKGKQNEQGRKEKVDVYSARCKTAKCVSRKGKVPEKKMKKK